MVDAREYHEETKHSPERVRASSHRLDPRTKPRPYKVYRDLDAVAPADELEGPTTPALEAIANRDPTPTGGDHTRGDRTEPPLHALCHYATGITKTLRRQGQAVPFRAAACTGKLYHVDCYLVTGDCGPAGPGVYHFDPHEDRFDVLREGDYRDVLAAATGGGTGVDEAPATVVVTSTWWRNAWKYRARTFRHAFWDSGTILANLLATAHGLGYRAEVVGAFADGPVVDLLGLDSGDEAPLELVPIGSGDPVHADGDGRGGGVAVSPIDPATEPPSPEQVEYPLIPDAWRQGTLEDGAATADWRETIHEANPADLGRARPGDGERVPLDPVDRETASARPVGTTIERRGSCRDYAREPINARRFATVLDRALRGVPGDWRGSKAGSGEANGAGEVPVPGTFLDAYVLVHAVEGIDSGAYQYHPDEGTLERVGDTDRETAGHIALDQPVVGDAAVNVYLLADVDATVSHVGNRGYRLTQLEGGIGLGRLYLATYAHRPLGGRGFTFYDDLVTDHLSPRAENQTPTTLFAFGRPA